MTTRNVSKERRSTLLGRTLISQLAREAPSVLLALIRLDAFPPEELTFAAETAGTVGRIESIDALLPLLENPSAVVREGAIYGLANYIANDQVRGAIRRVAQRDESETVRYEARSVLGDDEPGATLRFEDHVGIEIWCHGRPMALRGNLSLREAGSGATRLGYECRTCFRRVMVADGWGAVDAEVMVAHDQVE